MMKNVPVLKYICLFLCMSSLFWVVIMLQKIHLTYFKDHKLDLDDNLSRLFLTIFLPYEKRTYFATWNVFRLGKLGAFIFFIEVRNV